MLLPVPVGPVTAINTSSDLAQRVSYYRKSAFRRERPHLKRCSTAISSLSPTAGYGAPGDMRGRRTAREAMVNGGSVTALRVGNLLLMGTAPGRRMIEAVSAGSHCAGNHTLL